MRIEASKMRFLPPLLRISRRVKTSTDERRHVGIETRAEKIQEYKRAFHNNEQMMRHELLPEHA
jgi:hypothetical protein